LNGARLRASVLRMSAARCRVLIADDNVDQLVTLSMLLESEGFDVVALAHAEEIVATAKQVEPHVYLLDIGMPRCNGYEVAAKLRELFGSAPFLIAVTAYATPADRERAYRAGFDKHLAKPFLTEELLACMRDYTLSRAFCRSFPDAPS
jgi:CheY-like chemotaxis protein